MTKAALIRRVQLLERRAGNGNGEAPPKRRPHSLQTAQRATERTKTEELLREERDFFSAVLDTANALILVLDNAGRITRFNRACEQLSGYSSDEVMGRIPWDFLVPPEEVASVKALIRRLRLEHSDARYENHWVTKTGELRLISWANSVLREPDGTMKNIIRSGVDITEARRLETELLEISDRERRHIGQDLHDGLGQQLMAISLMCHSLTEDPNCRNPRLARGTAKITGLLKSAIRQVRSLSHGLAPLQETAGSLGDALREMARTTSASSRMKCIFRCEKPVLLTDNTAAGHLYRIAQEAVTNAIKHGHAHQIVITLKSSTAAVKLRIADNGTGLTRSRKRNKGMGLEVMKYRCNMISGNLAILSSPGKGTTVECTVPRRNP